MPLDPTVCDLSCEAHSLAVSGPTETTFPLLCCLKGAAVNGNSVKAYGKFPLSAYEITVCLFQYWSATVMLFISIYFAVVNTLIPVKSAATV